MSWEVLCKAKVHGGFGHRCAEGMNVALMSKLYWRMLTQSELFMGNNAYQEVRLRYERTGGLQAQVESIYNWERF